MMKGGRGGRHRHWHCYWTTHRCARDPITSGAMLVWCRVPKLPIWESGKDRGDSKVAGHCKSFPFCILYSPRRIEPSVTRLPSRLTEIEV
jgi:hypothetical protein